MFREPKSIPMIFTNESTVMDFEADPMQTIRPYFPRRQSEPSLPSDDISTTMIPITEPPPLPTTPTKSKPRKLMLPFRNTSRHPSVFREDAFEDYSDLAPVNEATFARKVDLMKVEHTLSPCFILCLCLIRFINRRMRP
jgi:hypothetical protein